MENGNTALFRRWFEEVWENEREEAVDEMATPDVIEVFFRFFKHVLGCRHLISHDTNGIQI